MAAELTHYDEKAIALFQAHALSPYSGWHNLDWYNLKRQERDYWRGLAATAQENE